MCRTTERTRTSSPPVVAPAQIPKPKALPPIVSLQKFLTDAYTAEKVALEPTGPKVGGFTLKNKEAAISILMIDNDGNHQYAEVNGTRMDYSGSLVKVAALYTAFDLRSEARKHAKDNTFANKNAFQSSFKSAINVSAAIKRLQDFESGRKPDLSEIFEGFEATGPNQVKFTTQFQNALDDIFNNPSAGKVIRALGYSYINVSLMRETFFTTNFSPPFPLNGIWLAGDYSEEKLRKSVRIPVSNDIVPGGSGQAITTKEMCRMFSLVHLRKAFSQVADATERLAANDDMHTILATQTSFFFNPANVLAETPLFSNHCAKVGIGTLGPIGVPPNPPVNSEGAVMNWNSNAEITSFNTAKQRKLSGFFAICWQNVYEPNPDFEALIRIFNSSIRNFLTQP